MLNAIRIRNLVGMAAGLVLTVVLASPATAVPTTYSLTAGDLTTVELFDLINPLSPLTPSGCDPFNPLDAPSCLAGPEPITAATITVDFDTNQLLGVSISIAGPATLNLGGLNGYTTAVLSGLTFTSQPGAIPLVIGGAGQTVLGLVHIDELYLDAFGPYEYAATAAPQLVLTFGPGGLTAGLSGLEVGVFTDVTGNDPVVAIAKFGFTAAVPEPHAAMLFGLSLAVAGLMTGRQRAAVAG